MKRCIRNTGFAISAILFCSALAPGHGSAHACAPDEVGVNWLAGRAVSSANRRQEPLAGATVELFTADDLVEPILATRTAPDGRFAFPEAGDGRYVLRVSREGFVAFSVPVRLIKMGSTPRTLLVHVGVGGEAPCGGGWAKVVLNDV